MKKIIADLFPETRVAPEDDPNKRYTTRETMDLCMRLAGVDKWDLDVAADAESHWADTWYGVEHDGLVQSWWGNVWVNPPYGLDAPHDLDGWCRRAWEAMTLPPDPLNHADVVAMLLPANRTEQPFWSRWVERYRDGDANRICWPFRQPGDVGHRSARLRTYFLEGRTVYGHPGNRNAIGVGSPPFASCLLVWRS